MEILGFLRDVGVSALGGGLGVALTGYLARDFIEHRLARRLAEHQSKLAVEAHRRQTSWNTIYEKRVEAATAINTEIEKFYALARGGIKRFQTQPGESADQQIQSFMAATMNQMSQVMDAFLRRILYLPDDFNRDMKAWVSSVLDYEILFAHTLAAWKLETKEAELPTEQQLEIFQKAYEIAVRGSDNVIWQRRVLAMLRALQAYQPMPKHPAS